MILKIDSDTYINYNEATKSVETLVKSTIEQEIAGLTATIANIPTDEQLLVWAKENHPQCLESAQLTQDRNRLQVLLDLISGT